MSFLLLAGGSLLLAWSPALAAPLDPDAVVRAALARDPAVVEAEAALSAARGALRASRLFLENPELSGEVSLTSELVAAELTQPVSLTGEGLAAARAARAAVRAAEAALDRSRLQVAAEARRALARAAAVASQARIAEAAFAEATRRREAARARLAQGELSPLEARLVRLEEAAAGEALLAARLDELDARAALARYVDGAAEADLPADPLAAAPLPSPAEAPALRSDRQAAEAEVEAARAALARARAASLPALSLGAFLEQDDHARSLGPAVSLTVPLWHHNPAGRAEAAGALAGAEARAAALAGVVEAEQAGTRAALAEAEAVLSTVGELGEAELSAALADLNAAWTAGELDLATAALLRTEVLNGWQASLDLRLAVAEVRLAWMLATEHPALLPPAGEAP